MNDNEQYAMPLTYTLIRRATVAILLLLSASTCVDAQIRNRIDNRGKEFWIAFLPTNGFDREPLLAISVACERPTRGTITYNRSGRSETFQINQANRAYRLNLDTFELLLPSGRLQSI